MFYPIESRIFGLTMVRRERLLPRSGEVLVRAGETVAALDVIGRASAPANWCFVDVAHSIGVAPDAAEALLSKPLGSSVEKGEVLAASKGGLGLFRRVCKAPIGGDLVAFRAGRLLIRQQSETVDLRALLRGRVAGVLPEFGALIETKGALIRAAWSAGESSVGVLKMMSDDAHIPLQASQMDVTCHGALLVAGWCATAEGLSQAEQIQARGVILGGLNAELFDQARRLSVPVFLVEGFGDLPMDAAAFNLLRAHAGEEASLLQGGDGLLPEIIIPVSTDREAAVALPPAALQPGQRVRLMGYPRRGALGRVMTVSALPRRLESGGMSAGVEVALDDGEMCFVPWPNVEPIG